MRFFKSLNDWDTPERIDASELIDDENQPYSDFRQSMKDVQRVNSYLGGKSIVSQQVRQWLRSAKMETDSSQPFFTFLDIATGSGDMLQTIQKTADSEHVSVRVIGLDYSPPILRFAREELKDLQDIHLIQGDAFRLPFADKSIDYVLCSLAFHHFGYHGSIHALSEMERVARRGWLVNDLQRSKIAWLLFRIVSTITRMNRMTRHDGPASVLRAYSLAEYQSMPAALGLQIERDFQVRRRLFYRISIVRGGIPI